VGALTTLLASATVFTITLAFAALGELISERAGAVNVSVEAMMLGSAFAATVVAEHVGGVLGVLAGIGAGVLVAAVQAALSHYWRADQFVIGLALNILVLGLTSFFLEKVTITPKSPSLWAIPLLHDLPLVGDSLFTRSWLSYLIIPVVPLAWLLLFRTRWGVQARSVGEDSAAAELAGVRVGRRRRQAVLICGVGAGLAGAHLALGDVGTFTQNMTAGTGYIVIAAVLFGGWSIQGALYGCALFGTTQALRLALPAFGVDITTELLIAAPYLLALAALILVRRRGRQPDCLGRPFVALTPAAR
jgi:ABC-type uncharacterized transport system permease subunit